MNIEILMYNIYIYINMHTYIHTYTHICIYIHIHKHIYMHNTKNIYIMDTPTQTYMMHKISRDKSTYKSTLNIYIYI